MANPDPLPINLTPSGIKRFWSFVEKGGSCWYWTGCKTYGYGCFRFGGTGYRAHRVSWTIHNGAIPDSLVVMHSCDNPPCVNPEHLFIGTQADNHKDMWSKGRGWPPPRLTEQQVLEIKNAPKPHGSRKLLASKFGVSAETIYRICNDRYRRGLGDRNVDN